MSEKVVIGNAELWHGDCREVLPLLPHVALVLTDPPYGIGIDGQKQSTNRNPKHNRKAHDFLGWDNETPERLVFELLRYKALGNSWAVPNVRWIGERIDAVEAIK